MALVGLLLLCNSLCWAQSRTDVLEQLRQIQSSNRKRMQDLDRRLKYAMSDYRTKQQAPIQVGASDGTTVTEIPVDTSTSLQEIDGYVVQFQEHLLRQEFFDRLILKVEMSYRGKDLSAFLQAQIKDMAIVESTTPNQNPAMRRFLTHLQFVMGQGMEKNENTIQFILGYLNYSSLSNPKDPKEFLESRNYNNSKESYKANSTGREDLGDTLENRMRLTRDI